nr:OB-fold domain-containing protein [Neobacillus sp. Marseille-Q6967]
MTNVNVYECAQCQKKFIQRKWVCPDCQHTEFDQKEINGEGKVFSFTRIHISSSEFAHLTPYTVALIDLEDGVRVTARLKEEVGINDRVKCISNQENAYVFSKI